MFRFLKIRLFNSVSYFSFTANIKIDITLAKIRSSFTKTFPDVFFVMIKSYRFLVSQSSNKIVKMPSYFVGFSAENVNIQCVQVVRLFWAPDSLMNKERIAFCHILQK